MGFWGSSQLRKQCFLLAAPIVIDPDDLDKVFVAVSGVPSLGKYKCLPLPQKVAMIKRSMILQNFTLGESSEFIGLTSEHG